MMESVKKILLMDDHVCPWQLAYTFDNPLRRLLHNPHQLLGEFIEPNQTVLDLGCGMGHFSLALAEMVGAQGRVIAVDLQQEMLARVRRRAERRRLASRIRLIRSSADRIGACEQVDFALAFWMAHETPDVEAFFREGYRLLKPQARFFLVEPKGHVSESQFNAIVETACAVGLKRVAKPQVTISRAVLFAKPEND